MLQLKNNCSCSLPTVSPKDWLTGGQALLKKTWNVHYYFRDPAQPEAWQKKYPYGMLIVIKRVNNLKTVVERRAAIKLILENEIRLLKEFEYNPVTGYQVKAIDPEDEDFDFAPSTPFNIALQSVFARLDVQKNTLRDIKSVVKYLCIAAARMRYDQIPVENIKMRHIKLLLDEVGRTQLIDDKGNTAERVWTANNYNVYRKYLHRIFEELIQMETLEYNPVTKITKKATIIKMRLTLTKEQRHDIINVYLKKSKYTFYRFCQIFFHSGARETELLRIQVKDVNLVTQKFKITVIKGKKRTEEERTIKDKALPFWKELIAGADPEFYIFSHGLKPGIKSMPAAQITRRWKLVKTKFNIVADIYSLKHSNLDETAAILDDAAAQKMAGHSTPVITIERYLGGAKDRKHELLKSVANDL